MCRECKCTVPRIPENLLSKHNLFKPPILLTPNLKVSCTPSKNAGYTYATISPINLSQFWLLTYINRLSLTRLHRAKSTKSAGSRGTWNSLLTTKNSPANKKVPKNPCYLKYWILHQFPKVRMLSTPMSLIAIHPSIPHQDWLVSGNHHPSNSQATKCKILIDWSESESLYWIRQDCYTTLMCN